MQVGNNPEVTLTLEQIELAIKEYIDKNIQEKVYNEGTKITFGLKDFGEDDDRGPYIPVWRLNEAKVKLAFQM